MVGTMLYGYKARTWVLISTDRSTMGTTLEEIGAPWIYISLSSGQLSLRIKEMRTEIRTSGNRGISITYSK